MHEQTKSLFVSSIPASVLSRNIKRNDGKLSLGESAKLSNKSWSHWLKKWGFTRDIDWVGRDRYLLYLWKFTNLQLKNYRPRHCCCDVTLVSEIYQSEERKKESKEVLFRRRLFPVSWLIGFTRDTNAQTRHQYLQYDIGHKSEKRFCNVSCLNIYNQKCNRLCCCVLFCFRCYATITLSNKCRSFEPFNLFVQCLVKYEARSASVMGWNKMGSFLKVKSCNTLSHYRLMYWGKSIEPVLYFV